MSRCICKVAAVLLLSAGLAHAAPGGDGNKPVEINADTLEVRQEENVAVFNGNVIAQQGDTRIRSDSMTVHYAKKEAAPADAAAVTTADPAQSKIKKIDVEGHVVVANPAESASGDRGYYDVERKEIHLFGDVVLTHGKNILKGDTLVYDMATGKSVVNSPGNAQQGVQNGRVRALFMPDKKGK